VGFTKIKKEKSRSWQIVGTAISETVEDWNSMDRLTRVIITDKFTTIQLCTFQCVLGKCFSMYWSNILLHIALHIVPKFPLIYASCTIWGNVSKLDNRQSVCKVLNQGCQHLAYCLLPNYLRDSTLSINTFKCNLKNSSFPTTNADTPETYCASEL